MKNETLKELKEKQLNLSNELKKIRIYSFNTAEKYNHLSKKLMIVQQQISITKANKK